MSAPACRGVAGTHEGNVADVEPLLLERGCPKLNIQVRATNTEVLEFYRRIGYARDEAVSFGKRLIPDEPAA